MKLIEKGSLKRIWFIAIISFCPFAFILWTEAVCRCLVGQFKSQVLLLVALLFWARLFVGMRRGQRIFIIPIYYGAFFLLAFFAKQLGH